MKGGVAASDLNGTTLNLCRSIKSCGKPNKAGRGHNVSRCIASLGSCHPTLVKPAVRLEPHLPSSSSLTAMEAPLVAAARATSSLSVRRTARVCRRCIATTTSREATPVQHPNIPGPPPSAPQASVSYPQDRVARKREQAEALRQSQQKPVNPSKPTSALQKRFWKNVSVQETDDGLQVHLDTRPVRTAQRQVLTLPQSKRTLAAGIALEWDQLVSAQQALKQHYIPLTSSSSRAMDIKLADEKSGPKNEVRENIVRVLMKYLSTDTLLCWAPSKNIHDPDRPGVKPLRQRQREIAEPIIAYLTTHVFPGIEINPILDEASIIPASQPEITTSVIRGWIAGLPAFELAALERGVLATKSLLVAARLLVEWSSEYTHLRQAETARSDDGTIEIERERFDIERAFEAANLEVLHQTEQWGEVEDTHDVDKEDVRAQLGSVILLVS